MAIGWVSETIVSMTQYIHDENAITNNDVQAREYRRITKWFYNSHVFFSVTY